MVEYGDDGVEPPSGLVPALVVLRIEGYMEGENGQSNLEKAASNQGVEASGEQVAGVLEEHYKHHEEEARLNGWAVVIDRWQMGLDEVL